MKIFAYQFTDNKIETLKFQTNEYFEGDYIDKFYFDFVNDIKFITNFAKTMARKLNCKKLVINYRCTEKRYLIKNKK